MEACERWLELNLVPQVGFISSNSKVVCLAVMKAHPK